MSYGGEQINGKFVTWGFSSVKDWLESVILSFPAPWTIGTDTHYGTEIFDARQKRILSFWKTEGQEPSKRELGGDSLEEWNENCCNNHWESQFSLDCAETVMALRNRLVGVSTYENADLKDLVTIIVSEGCWSDDVAGELECGGPDRRLAEPQSKHARRMMGYK